MSLGIELGKGRSLKDVLNKRLTVTEGIYTAGAVVEMAAARGIDMPIAQAVHAVISGLATVDEAIEALLARPLRAEVCGRVSWFETRPSGAPHHEEENPSP